jgi:hypothetical protein
METKQWYSHTGLTSKSVIKYLNILSFAGIAPESIKLISTGGAMYTLIDIYYFANTEIIKDVH